MISAKVTTYCDGDFRDIENYEDALLDNSCVWKLFHRNLLTCVGRLKPNTLKNLNKFYHVKPEELIFLPKKAVRQIEIENPFTSVSMDRCNTVFYFWGLINPDKLYSEMPVEEFNRFAISIPRLRIIFHQMKARCYKEGSQDWKWYGAKGIKICDEWLDGSDKFVTWSLQNGYIYRPGIRKGDQLSIDRIDATKDYSPENCRWIPHRQNCMKANISRGIQEDKEKDIPVVVSKGERWNYIKEKFAYAIEDSTIDWGKIVKKECGDDLRVFKKFLASLGYARTYYFLIVRNLRMR